MKHFHRKEGEKRSIVVLNETEYQEWLHAKHDQTRNLLNLSPNGFLETEKAPR